MSVALATKAYKGGWGMRQVLRTRPWVLLREPQRFVDFFHREGKLKEIPKGGSFLTHGSINGQTALLLEGLVSFDFVDNAGRQRTFALILPNRMLGDLDVLNPVRPNVVVEVLQPSKFLVVDNHVFRRYLRESVETMELYADLSILKEEGILEGAFANFSMDLDSRLRALFLSILQSEKVEPDAEGWMTLPITLSVTDITRIVSASRAWVSTTLSDWCETGLMKKEVHTMAFREAVFEGLRDWMADSKNVRPTSIHVE